MKVRLNQENGLTADSIDRITVQYQRMCDDFVERNAAMMNASVDRIIA